MIIFNLSGFGSSGVFGTSLHEVEEVLVSTKDLADYSEKIKLITDPLDAGKYRIGWSYSWNLDSLSHNFLARIVLNDTEILSEHVQEPKDSTGNFSNTGTDQSHKASGFLFKNLAGTNEIRLDWGRTGPGGIETSIWDARLELWRVE